MNPAPRATDQIDDDGSFGPYFRFRCGCCGFPTLESSTPDLDATPWPQVCLLCDWENAAPDARVDEDDSVSLTQARTNVARYAWMYDPTNPPAWHIAPPDREELKMRLRLRDIYAAIDQEPTGPRFFELWEAARTAEEELVHAARHRSSRSADAQDGEFSDIDLADPGALVRRSDPDGDDDDGDGVEAGDLTRR